MGLASAQGRAARVLHLGADELKERHCAGILAYGSIINLGRWIS